MKVLYLCAGMAFHNLVDFDFTYQDINGFRDIGGDCMNVDLSGYDILVASPPCNYWSHANYRRESSSYSLLTKHLLPDLIKKFIATGKPFIIENVRNQPLMAKNGIFFLGCDYYFLGRHTFFTNIKLSHSDLDYLIGLFPKDDFVNRQCSSVRQGGSQVKFFIDYILTTLIAAKSDKPDKAAKSDKPDKAAKSDKL